MKKKRRFPEIYDELFYNFFAPHIREIHLKGGRGGGKSHVVAYLVALFCLVRFSMGLDTVCVITRKDKSNNRGSTDAEIEAALIDIEPSLRGMVSPRGVDGHISHQANGVSFKIHFRGLQRCRKEGIKSMKGIHLIWFEEAQEYEYEALDSAINTVIRYDKCKIITSHNPQYPEDGVETYHEGCRIVRKKAKLAYRKWLKRVGTTCDKCKLNIEAEEAYCLATPSGRVNLDWYREDYSKPDTNYCEACHPPEKPSSYELIVNYNDINHFVTALSALSKRAEECKERDILEYNHTWLGHFKPDNKSSVYGSYITKAVNEGRTNVDTSMITGETIIVADLGSAGQSADPFIFWFFKYDKSQGKIYAIDFYQAQSRSYEDHEQHLLAKGYTHRNCKIYLPWDAGSSNRTNNTTWESAFRDGGWSVEIIGMKLGIPKDVKRSVAYHRVITACDIFPRMYFSKNFNVCAALSDLRMYKTEYDEQKKMTKYVHDIYSHCADAFGYAAVAFKFLIKIEKKSRRVSKIAKTNGAIKVGNVIGIGSKRFKL